MEFNDNLKQFVVDLFKINGLKFGDFKLKTGVETPVYCDLRIISSYPKLLNTLANLFIEYIKSIEPFDIICGVPYSALPIATVVSVNMNVPMVMRHKEIGNENKSIIEGVYTEGNKCLLIEDVVVFGDSILETVRDLNNVGIKCTDAVVFLNREQGGKKILEEHGIKMHALLNLTQLAEYLRQENYIEDSIVNMISSYLQNWKTDACMKEKVINRLKLPYTLRLPYCKNPVVKKLFKIISEKQSNLCLAADVTKSVDLLDLAKKAGPHICMFKTHIDIIEDFSPYLIKTLKNIAETYNFILYEDRKFADIAKTVKFQYSEGIYQISSWSELVTAHSLMGKEVLNAISESNGLPNRGVLLLAETSTADSPINDNYIMKTMKLAAEYPNLIAGIICQNPLFLDNPGIIQLTPGVQLIETGDNLGQQYHSPATVILQGADVAVVGRGITQSINPEVAAENYKKILWDAYLKRIEQ